MRKSISFVAALSAAASKSIKSCSVAFAAVMAICCLYPAAAFGHVTLSPNSAPAGSWTTFNVKVPNESDTASTVKVVVKMPQGITSASWQPVPGWQAQVEKVKLAAPVQTDDGPLTEGVSQVVWTADGKGIQPGQFQQFPLTILVPETTGATLTFKAIQTYSDGKVSRWIGSPSADEPAPTVSVTDKVDEHSAAMAGGHESSDSSDHSLQIVALVLSGLALLVACGALTLARRNR